MTMLATVAVTGAAKIPTAKPAKGALSQTYREVSQESVATLNHIVPRTVSKPTIRAPRLAHNDAESFRTFPLCPPHAQTHL